jgi:hypothetical protein
MGFININNLPQTPPIPGGEMTVYLTKAGREALLNNGFNPTQFSISDMDVNYLGNQTLNQVTNDLTGDYDDIIYSLSNNVTISNPIIQ